MQEAHEDKIKQFVRKESLQELFCDLNDYNSEYLQDSLFYFGTLKAFRYSPSRINIALGWASVFIAGVLAIIHILVCLYFYKLYCFYIALTATTIIFMFAIITLILCYMKNYIKGGKPNKPKLKQVSKWNVKKIFRLFKTKVTFN